MAEELRPIAEIRNINAGSPFTKPIREWKKQGGKARAFQGNFISKELIREIGILPIKQAGDFYQKMDLGDAD